MAISVVAVQGSRVKLGIGLEEAQFLLVPGSNDYVSNGYVITTTLTGFSKIQQAFVSGQNATATGWIADPVFVVTQMGAAVTGEGFTGYSQFLFKLLVVTSGLEPTASSDIGGAVWAVTVRGF